LKTHQQLTYALRRIRFNEDKLCRFKDALLADLIEFLFNKFAVVVGADNNRYPVRHGV